MSRFLFPAVYVDEVNKTEPEPKPKAENPLKGIHLRILLGTATLAEKEEYRVARISKFLEERDSKTRNTGKTLRHRRSGYFNRKRERRVAHEGWMHKVGNDPRTAHAHPFYT